MVQMKTEATKGDLCANIVVPNAGPRRYKHLLERSGLKGKENEILAVRMSTKSIRKCITHTGAENHVLCST